MAETETVATEQAPKKGGRKPDPLTRAIADMKEAGKHLGDYQVKDVPEARALLHDQRAAAWGRTYADQGVFDALLLSLAFEALAGLNPAEQRYALLQLSAVALGRAAELDGRA
ncbi:hypothetical protein KGG85_gp42 [Streptomyces phage Tefunt]|uniref:Uncharacterized protein n=2 Tax=Omarvirus TaxID=2948847 RepID=A0A291LIF7_9CAUD|nr:hypothetical protein KGG78_gp40 [Streptomyces phage Diane]YP_010055410.1 hypothetical protein KGG85_gp42 [Streptomyces phage Tefunt]AXH70246.1 hypothetical protein SEA_HAIZUM_42 [Streptomyces phage Haizum]QAY15783.1 hypothetical protein SEA_NISHIKIGOI_42 [Streptomyces phage Nishikigoi]ATI18824.1 hypothetical protein SEA_DIANE_40 [Streptomyces phage Diane]ATI18982.1 hypothetical protein SEA_TEFUNT_42 [Streptomyces phage Tefunt]